MFPESWPGPPTMLPVILTDPMALKPATTPLLNPAPPRNEPPIVTLASVLPLPIVAELLPSLPITSPAIRTGPIAPKQRIQPLAVPAPPRNDPPTVTLASLPLQIIAPDPLAPTPPPTISPRMVTGPISPAALMLPELTVAPGKREPSSVTDPRSPSNPPCTSMNAPWRSDFNLRKP